MSLHQIFGSNKNTNTFPRASWLPRDWPAIQRHLGCSSVSQALCGQYHKDKRNLSLTHVSFSPPLGGGAEAANLPRHRYNMSNDLSHFVPPDYAIPPRNLWYDVPNQEAPKQIFPWEAQQPKPSRVFGESGSPPPRSPPTKVTEPDVPPTPTTAATDSEPGERRSEPRPSGVFPLEFLFTPK